jgi:hypothetical protein
MNAASETATAMIQGLPLACQISSTELAAIAALIRPSHPLQRSGAENSAAVLDFSAVAFKGGFLYRDFHQLDARPMLASDLRRDAVTYRLSEVESFSLMRHNDGYFIAWSAPAADVHFCFRISLIALRDGTSQGFAERQLEIAFRALNTLRSFNQPHHAVYRRRYGVNVTRHPGVDFQDARMGEFS